MLRSRTLVLQDSPPDLPATDSVESRTRPKRTPISFVSFDDTSGGLVDVLMLPDPYDTPSELAQSFVRVPIALLVDPYLFAPPFDIALGLGPVDRATVPEATVHEDREVRAGEDDVHRACRSRNEAPLDPEAKPSTMQYSAEESIRAIVLAARCGHASAGLGRGWFGSPAPIHHKSFRLLPPIRIAEASACSPATSGDGRQRHPGTHPRT